MWAYVRNCIESETADHPDNVIIYLIVSANKVTAKCTWRQRRAATTTHDGTLILINTFIATFILAPPLDWVSWLFNVHLPWRFLAMNSQARVYDSIAELRKTDKILDHFIRIFYGHAPASFSSYFNVLIYTAFLPVDWSAFVLQNVLIST